MCLPANRCSPVLDTFVALWLDLFKEKKMQFSHMCTKKPNLQIDKTTIIPPDFGLNVCMLHICCQKVRIQTSTFLCNISFNTMTIMPQLLWDRRNSHQNTQKGRSRSAPPPLFLDRSIDSSGLLIPLIYPATGDNGDDTFHGHVPTKSCSLLRIACPFGRRFNVTADSHTVGQLPTRVHSE